MAERTEIAWCDSTFNPWIGCTKVGPGCDNCYAKADFNDRKHRVVWGAGQARSRTSTANWKKPLQWNAKAFYQCAACAWRGDDPIDGADHLRLHACPACLGDVLPTRRRVFCASLADVFDNEVTREWRLELFNLIEQTPNLDWLLLTKRIGNAARMMEDVGHPFPGATLPHVWIGASIVTQEEADRDIPKLMSTPAAVRFLSMEPLLGPVEFSNVARRSDCVSVLGKPAMEGIDWVIVGGESGPSARPMSIQWARSLRDQCAAAGVPFLFKQWGEWAPQARIPEDTSRLRSGDSFSWLPNGRGPWSYRVGKKAAGRLLDGVTHNGFPEVSNA